MRAEYTHFSCPNLTCSFDLPPAWQQIEIAFQPETFEGPFEFHALGVAKATPGDCTVTVSARPAYDEGTVRSWLELYCMVSGLQIQSVQELNVAGLRAVSAEVMQPNDSRPLRTRLVYLEDGERLFTLLAVASCIDWYRQERNVDSLIDSFRISAAEPACEGAVVLAL